jgi:hypothetical protein
MYVAWRSRDTQARSYRMILRGLASEAASCTSRSGAPTSRAAVMNAWRNVCWLIGFVISARRATRRTTRLAP